MFYVLGMSSADYAEHKQIDFFGPFLPKYEHMKNTVIKDLTVGITALCGCLPGLVPDVIFVNKNEIFMKVDELFGKEFNEK